MSDSDEETIMGLMSLLDDVEPSIDLPSRRSDFPDSVKLRHFSVNENGPANFRDATVLGEHTTILLPPSEGVRCKIGIYLNHEVSLTSYTTVSAPVFVSDNLKATHRELSDEYPIGKHELWVRPSELENGIVRFKKRDWDLSRGFRKVTAARWPRFIITATVYQVDESFRTFVSADFEVRSKEQSNKARAARGLSEPVRRRRTPETEARATKLRAIQSDIIAMREEIELEKSKSSEYETRFRFMKAMTANNKASAEISSILARVKC